MTSQAHRLPPSLDDIEGSPAGIVELPLHVAWSGRVYDVGEEDQRLVLHGVPGLVLVAAWPGGSGEA